MRALIVLALTMMVGALGLAHAQSGGVRPAPATDPRPPVVEAYRMTMASLGAPGHGNPLDEPHRSRLLSTRLAALVAADQAESRKNDEPGRLNYDPFINGQDGEVQGLQLKALSSDGRKGTVRASFRSFGEAMTIDFALVFENGAWRIDDISPIGKDGKPEFKVSDVLMGKE